MGESRQSTTADCDIEHFVSHNGETIWKTVTNSRGVGGMSVSGRLKCIWEGIFLV
jgi:hypothetical protein